MGRDLVDASNRQMRDAGQIFTEYAPEGVVRRFGSIVAGATGTPIPSFNRVVVTEQPGREDLGSAVAWMAERDVPFWVTATDATRDAVRNLESAVDLVPADESPGMVRDSLDDLPPPESAAAITTVTGEPALGEFLAVFESAFGVPEKIGRQLVPPSLLSDETIRVLIGRVDGEPVATGMLVRTGDVAGVYNIAVVESFRRRGIGEAMTWAVLRAGREAGCEVGVLQSSEMAVPLYRQMGFETVVTYHHFEPVRQAASDAPDE